MSNSELQMLKPFGDVLESRRQVWEQLDAAQALSGKTHDNLKVISNNGTVTSVDLPVSEETPPPAQIKVIADAITRDLADRNTLQSDIVNYRKQIEDIKNHVTNTLIGIVVILLVLAVGGYFLFLS